MAKMSDEQAAQAITRLNELTQEGQISWRTADPEVLEDHIKGDIQASVFETTHSEKRLFLYKHTTEVYTSPREAQYTGIPAGKHTQVNVRLDIVDSNGKPVWTFPETSAVEDLYSTVSYHASGASELIDQLVDEQNG